MIKVNKYLLIILSIMLVLQVAVPYSVCGASEAIEKEKGEISNPAGDSEREGVAKSKDAASPRGRPNLSISERKYDFGLVKTNKTVSHDFIIENLGAGELEIKKVTPG